MNTYPISLSFIEHGKETEKSLYDYLDHKSTDPLLKPFLDMDLSFIDFRAQSSGYFNIQDVRHVQGNLYTLSYSINYSIYNLCSDMDINDDFETAINFMLYDNHIHFDVIESERDTIEEF